MVIDMQYFNGNVILVTGAIRTGKTLYVVSGLKDLVEKENKKPENERRKFFSDIDGLAIEGVGISPTDWRDAPAGSFIIYDECQLNPYFQADGSAVSKHDFVLQLTLAGRKGYTIVFISQSPRFVHGTIRNLANEHIHVQRLHGAEKALICRYPKPVLNPDSKANIDKCADKFNWNYPKTTYGDYSSLDSNESNAQHQIKFKMPAPILKGLGFMTLLFVGLVYYGGSSFFGDKDVGEVVEDKKAGAVSALSPVKKQQDKPKIGAILGAYLKEGKCIVYDANAVIDENHKDCINYLKPVYTTENYMIAKAKQNDRIRQALNDKKGIEFYNSQSYENYQKEF